jgi:hypothetical protein
MGHVVACGAGYCSDEHFVKKDHRKMFMTIPTMEARLSLLKRKYDMMFGK